MKAIDRSNTWFRKFKLEVFHCVLDNYNLSINMRADECMYIASHTDQLSSYEYIHIVPNFLQG